MRSPAELDREAARSSPSPFSGTCEAVRHENDNLLQSSGMTACSLSFEFLLTNYNVMILNSA